MSASAASQTEASPTGFRHDAFLYSDDGEFLDGTLAFLMSGLDAGEPALVIVDDRKIRLLGEALGSDRGEVTFADMAEIGGNPARILSVWQQFVRDRAGPGRPARGIGEPVWPERTPAELVECHRHESLLNLAFASSPAWWLICPYHTKSLPAPVIEEAFNSHPFVMTAGGRHPSASFAGPHDAAGPFALPLPEPPAERVEQSFDAAAVPGIRIFIAGEAVAAGVGGTRAADFALAVHELATNSIRYGGGEGLLRLWREPGAIVCEIRDQGRIDYPLAGREFPSPDQDGGRGLWLVNQLCDLVQARTMPEGNVVRVSMRVA